MLASALAFAQVILIDFALSADNALVIGMAAHGLPDSQRKKAVLFGIAAALVLRIVLALIANTALQFSGAQLFGGIALAYVACKMYRELVGEKTEREHPGAAHAHKSMATAVWEIAVADVSMSVDNVLAVASASEDHPGVMVFGIALSVILMAVGANYAARAIDRYWQLGWAALVVIAGLAGHMIWKGAHACIS